MNENELSKSDELKPDLDPPKEKSLANLSMANIERLLAEFIQKAVSNDLASDEDSLRNEIISEAVEMAKKYFYSINLTAASIARLVKTGKIETIWDHPDVKSLQGSETANNKSLPDNYIDLRKAADDGLRQFVSVNSEINPISAALAATQEDIAEGAAPRYGNWAVFITPSPEIESRIVFSAEDSFRSVDSETFEFDDSSVLTLNHAFIAVAIHKKFFKLFLDLESQRRIQKLRNYVEAAIFEPITLEKISLIICNLNSEEEVQSARDVLDLIDPIKDKIKFVFSDDIDPQVRQDFDFSTSTY